jgi:SAM-dependent methyltransferase
MVDLLFSDAGLAALYDTMHPPDQRADFAFYLPLIMTAEAVLDVGCGTGALLREARKRGHQGRLCGLDPAEGMLAQARQRTDIEWIQGDLTSAARNGEFDLVVMTGHAFQMLIEDAELRAALAAIRSALTKDGRLAFETRNPSARAWANWTKAPLEIVGSNSSGTKRVIEITTPFDGQVLSFTQTFTTPDRSEPLVSHSTLRFLDAPTLSSFLSAAGLVIEAQFGDWDRRPLTDSAREIITIARPR